MATAESYGGTCVSPQPELRSTSSCSWVTWAEGNMMQACYTYARDDELIQELDSYPTAMSVRAYKPCAESSFSQELEPEPESEEERLTREREEEAARLAREKEEQEEKEDEHKANVLLLELIGHSDYKKFCRSGYMDVEGNSGKVYRIKPRAMTKVFAGKDKLDVALESLCIAMRDSSLPRGDEMVWKKLMIESNEKAFVETANHFNR